MIPNLSSPYTGFEVKPKPPMISDNLNQFSIQKNTDMSADQIENTSNELVKPPSSVVDF